MSIGYGNGTNKPDSNGWLLIFRHNIAGGYFSSADDWSEAKWTNPTDPTSNKFSILDGIHDKMKFGDEYIFKMVMDSYTNIWAQTNHPYTDVAYASTVPGYRAISIGTSGNAWGGISRANTSSAFIDGNPANTNWYYPIASNASWNGGLPQYDSTGHSFVELYIQVKEAL